MTRRALVVLALTLPSLLGGCQSSEHEGGLDLERMVDQIRYDAYDASDVFDDGMAMRTPPEGTLPFGPVPERPVRTGLRDGAPVMSIPVPLTGPLLERGRERFAIYCAACHGLDGNGATPVAAAMELRPPPSLHAERIRTMPPGALFRVVTEGYGMMPGYAPALDVRERWAVVAYLRALQLSRRLPLDSVSPALRRRILAELRERRTPAERPDTAGRP